MMSAKESGAVNAWSKKKKKLLLPEGGGVDVSDSHQSIHISSSRCPPMTSLRSTERDPPLFFLKAQLDVNRDAHIALQRIADLLNAG